MIRSSNFVQHVQRSKEVGAEVPKPPQLIVKGKSFKANAIIKRAVALADFPAKFEPFGLRKDGSKKHPDGYNYDSFKTGKPLAWDFTCSDTLAPCHIEKSSIETGKTAVWAEENKFTTYGNARRDDYHFFPMAVETFCKPSQKLLAITKVASHRKSCKPSQKLQAIPKVVSHRKSCKPLQKLYTMMIFS